jgi:deoxyadenosine/deoxycytidine kinase
MVTDDGDVWDLYLPPADRRGCYIAFSGNTASGKSSLIAELERRLRADGLDAVGVNERVLHHRYLPLMFARPRTFAFPVQLSFMIDRHMILTRNLVELGRTVLIERSHLDDVLFVQEHVDAGTITDAQYRSYLHLAEQLHAQLPAPDVLVLMNADPDLSLRRLAAAERRGERPAEFPDEGAKEAWVRRWHGRYLDLHQSFRDHGRDGGPLSGTKLVEIDPSDDLERIAADVLAAIRPLTGR